MNYFHKKGSNSASFLSVGIGIYNIKGYNPSTYLLNFFEEVSDDSELGFIVKGGIEIEKIRLALEYNIVPEIDFEGGENKYSYLGISIGFYLGGGK